jgi:hypothetical protein
LFDFYRETILFLRSVSHVFSLLFHQIWVNWFLFCVRLTAWAPTEIFCAAIFFIVFCSARVREFCWPDLDFDFKFSSAQRSIWFLVVFAPLVSLSSWAPIDLLLPLPAVAVLFASSVKHAGLICPFVIRRHRDRERSA